MSRASRKSAGATAPAAAHPAPSPDAVPYDVLREYRLTVAHTHAGKAYRVGDIVEISEREAAAIRRYAGADALVRVRT